MVSRVVQLALLLAAVALLPATGLRRASDKNGHLSPTQDLVHGVQRLAEHASAARNILKQIVVPQSTPEARLRAAELEAIVKRHVEKGLDAARQSVSQELRQVVFEFEKLRTEIVEDLHAHKKVSPDALKRLADIQHFIAGQRDKIVHQQHQAAEELKQPDSEISTLIRLGATASTYHEKRPSNEPASTESVVVNAPRFVSVSTHQSEQVAPAAAELHDAAHSEDNSHPAAVGLASHEGEGVASAEALEQEAAHKAEAQGENAEEAADQHAETAEESTESSESAESTESSEDAWEEAHEDAEAVGEAAELVAQSEEHAEEHSVDFWADAPDEEAAEAVAESGEAEEPLVAQSEARYHPMEPLVSMSGAADAEDAELGDQDLEAAEGEEGTEEAEGEEGAEEAEEAEVSESGEWSSEEGSSEEEAAGLPQSLDAHESMSDHDEDHEAAEAMAEMQRQDEEVEEALNENSNPLLVTVEHEDSEDAEHAEVSMEQHAEESLLAEHAELSAEMALQLEHTAAEDAATEEAAELAMEEAASALGDELTEEESANDELTEASEEDAESMEAESEAIFAESAAALGQVGADATAESTQDVLARVDEALSDDAFRREVVQQADAQHQIELDRVRAEAHKQMEHLMSEREQMATQLEHLQERLEKAQDEDDNDAKHRQPIHSSFRSKQLAEADSLAKMIRARERESLQSQVATLEAALQSSADAEMNLVDVQLKELEHNQPRIEEDMLRLKTKEELHRMEMQERQEALRESRFRQINQQLKQQEPADPGDRALARMRKLADELREHNAELLQAANDKYRQFHDGAR